MDPLLMLDRIYGDDELDSSSLLKTMESRLKLKIGTGAEASALNALHHARPRILHKGRPTMVNVANRSRLNMVHKQTDWKSGGEGVKNFIVSKMNILQASIATDIVYAFGNDASKSKAYMVASNCLSATVTFLTQLLGIVDVIYERLLTYSKLTSEQAWSLTMQILDRVLADLYVPKGGVVESLRTGSLLSICSHILWACFKTHDIMSAYVDLQFENHPAVSTQYVKSLATNSESEKVLKLTEAVEAMNSKVTSATEEAKKAVSKADVAAAKSADLLRAFNALS